MENFEEHENKIKVVDERAEDVFTTKEAKTTFDNISADTMPRESAVNYKKETVLEIREGGLISQNVVKYNPTVYVGSGTDIEYPLSLGSRKIILVDPILKEAGVSKKIKEKIMKIIGIAPEQLGENEFKFKFHFGEGLEEIIIKLEFAAYRSSKKDEKIKIKIPSYGAAPAAQPKIEPENIPEFHSPENIGLLLGFRTGGVEIDENKEAMERLAEGGYILVDNVFSSFLRSLTDEEKDEYLYKDSPKRDRVIELLKKKYLERGFEFIELKTEKDGYNYTFLRKLKK